MFYTSTKKTSPKGDVEESKTPDTFLNTALIIGTVSAIASIAAIFIPVK